MAQIAPDQPVLAMAGIAANRRYDDGQGKLVADLMLRGQEILNPNRGRRRPKPDKGTLIPMPAEQKMRLDFDNYVRDASPATQGTQRLLPGGQGDLRGEARWTPATRTRRCWTAPLGRSRCASRIGPVETYNGRARSCRGA
jgi:hypothetical protein